MFAKLIVIVLASGVTAAALLSMRQQRVETAHEMARLYQLRQMQERSLWRLRSEVAEACRPAAIRGMMEGLGEEWRSVPDPEPAGDGADGDPRLPAAAPPVAGGPVAAAAGADGVDDIAGVEATDG